MKRHSPRPSPTRTVYRQRTQAQNEEAAALMLRGLALDEQQHITALLAQAARRQPGLRTIVQAMRTQVEGGRL